MTDKEKALRKLSKKDMTATQLAATMSCSRMAAYRLVRALFTEGAIYRVRLTRQGKRGPAAWLWGASETQPWRV